MPAGAISVTDAVDCCAFSVEEEEHVIGYGWVQPQNPPLTHVGEAAFVVGDRARSYVPDIYHACLDMLLTAVRAKGYLRVQCHVPADSDTARWFAERLGFVHEGRIVRFGPGGTDMLMMRMESS